MNEKLKELARLAKIPTYYPEGISERLEKFAELIIEECCSSIRLEDAYNGGRFQRIILEHFGVK